MDEPLTLVLIRRAADVVSYSQPSCLAFGDRKHLPTVLACPTIGDGSPLGIRLRSLGLNM